MFNKIEVFEEKKRQKQFMKQVKKGIQTVNFLDFSYDKTIIHYFFYSPRLLSFTASVKKKKDRKKEHISAHFRHRELTETLFFSNS